MKANWNDFINDRIEAERAQYDTTEERRHRKTVEAQMEEMLGTNLTAGEKVMMDEVLFNLHLQAELDSKRLYQQGMRDCVAVLKTLGVLA